MCVCASCAISHESFIPVADGIHIIMTVERIKWKMDILQSVCVWSLNVTRGLLIFLQITGLFLFVSRLDPITVTTNLQTRGSIGGERTKNVGLSLSQTFEFKHFVSLSTSFAFLGYYLIAAVCISIIKKYNFLPCFKKKFLLLFFPVWVCTLNTYCFAEPKFCV